MYALTRASTAHSTRIRTRIVLHHARYVTTVPRILPRVGSSAAGATSSSTEPSSKGAESNPNPSKKLDALPSPFTRRPPGESPYRESSSRPGKAAADRGRNLSQRWAQMERALRVKKGLVKEKEDIEKEISENLWSTEGDRVGALVKEAGRENVETFSGLVIPKKPEPPADDECCMSGCAICVYDLYEDSLESYDESVHAIQLKLRSLGVSEAEWPDSIRPKQSEESTTSSAGGGKSQVLSAFEELERKLAARA